MHVLYVCMYVWLLYNVLISMYMYIQVHIIRAFNKYFHHVRVSYNLVIRLLDLAQLQ